jgi:hypothetical protein
MKPKAKKGQALVLALIVMGVGLIVIVPLLHYVDTTYGVYISANTHSNAYYAADAMMEQIMNDMLTGQFNTTKNYGQSPANGLNGYNVSTVISNNITWPPSTPTLGLDKDFTITTTATKNNKNVSSVTAAIRWTSNSSITIFSWQPKYY